jgi:chemotaxis protein MotB
VAKRQHEEKENRERWLLTYADLITLLMIFFVVMYAISRVDVVKFKQLSEALSVVFGGGRTLVGEAPGARVIALPVPAQASDLEEVRASVEELMRRQGLRRGSSAQVEQQALKITLADTLLFPAASASIVPQARPRLVALGKLLSETDGPIRVEGHTDNRPVRTGQFSSNWQLSALRAANIAQLLVEQAGIDPQRISAIGYGDSRPIADNRTPEGRARNSRVVIVLPR